MIALLANSDFCVPFEERSQAQGARVITQLKKAVSAELLV